jgi:hypothetical protein
VQGHVISTHIAIALSMPVPKFQIYLANSELALLLNNVGQLLSAEMYLI